MGRLVTSVGLAAGLLLTPLSAMAADPLMSMPAIPGGHCVVMQRSPLLDLPPAQLRAEVEQRYAHAVETANRLDVIYSNRPAFTWAYETKYSCGKAIGYLKTSTREEDTISKCDCFHDRMVRFLY